MSFGEGGGARATEIGKAGIVMLAKGGTNRWVGAGNRTLNLHIIFAQVPINSMMTSGISERNKLLVLYRRRLECPLAQPGELLSRV